MAGLLAGAGVGVSGDAVVVVVFVVAVVVGGQGAFAPSSDLLRRFLGSPTVFTCVCSSYKAGSPWSVARIATREPVYAPTRRHYDSFRLSDVVSIHRCRWDCGRAHGPRSTGVLDYNIIPIITLR
ncbi:hypothetical protein BC834DRAFT_861552 [Gloeopeniophorella convolvens]|nr:hypothetical protein BC834DRAFT_861552 [Gloeopeniophorella convolvens]